MRHAAGGAPYVFDRAPYQVYWELARACDLACRHCRAEAVPARGPHELDRAEEQHENAATTKAWTTV